MFSTYCFLLNIATTFEKVRGTANLRPTARYTLPTDLPSYAKIVICGKVCISRNLRQWTATT